MKSRTKGDHRRLPRLSAVCLHRSRAREPSLTTMFHDVDMPEKGRWDSWMPRQVCPTVEYRFQMCQLNEATYTKYGHSLRSELEISAELATMTSGVFRCGPTGFSEI